MLRDAGTRAWGRGTRGRVETRDRGRVGTLDRGRGTRGRGTGDERSFSSSGPHPTFSHSQSKSGGSRFRCELAQTPSCRGLQLSWVDCIPMKTQLTPKQVLLAIGWWGNNNYHSSNFLRCCDWSRRHNVIARDCFLAKKNGPLMRKAVQSCFAVTNQDILIYFQPHLIID